MKTTLVTCFYAIRSKFPRETYLQWAAEYMRLKSPIVLFTTAEYAPLFKSMRGSLPIHIIVRPFEELDSVLLYKDIWESHYALDHEARIHSPELYALWANKAFFVKEAIQTNPFGTQHYFWCDIGAFRTPITDPKILSNFPLASRFPNDRILLSSVARLKAGDSDFQHVDRIVGGLWGGTGDACLRWLAAYESMLIDYSARGKFAGKDQSIMLSAYLANPEVATVALPTVSDIDPWFYLTRLLSDPAVCFEQDISYNLNKSDQCVSVRIMGGLGNQLFQIAAAYSHAKCHGYSLVLPRYKQEEDNRSLYWDTVLYRFVHLLTDSVNHPIVYEKKHHVYSEFPGVPNIKLEGYFQSLLYFKKYLPDLRKLFAPSGSVLRTLSLKYEELLSAKERVVVVHARRGDYVSNAWNVIYHGPLPVSYYVKSMEAMKSYVADPIYLLCSDEPQYWIETMASLSELLTQPFHILCDEDEIYTLALLCQFQHFILANSTFSWWAAVLSQSKHVIAPKAWYGPKGPSYVKELYDPCWEIV
jgi:hypothetical protein